MPLPGGTTDFSTVEKYADLAAGEYKGHVEYVRFKEAKTADKSDQLSVCVESDEEETKGARAWQNLYFSPKSLWRMAEFFDVFGITEIDWETGLSDEDPFDLLDPDLSGEPIVFRVIPDGQYRGKDSFKTEVVEWLGKKPSRAARPAAAAKDEDQEAGAAEDPPEKEVRRPSAGSRRQLR